MDSYFLLSKFRNIFSMETILMLKSIIYISLLSSHCLLTLPFYCPFFFVFVSSLPSNCFFLTRQQSSLLIRVPSFTLTQAKERNKNKNNKVTWKRERWRRLFQWWISRGFQRKRSARSWEKHVRNQGVSESSTTQFHQHSWLTWSQWLNTCMTFPRKSKCATNPPSLRVAIGRHRQQLLYTRAWEYMTCMPHHKHLKISAPTWMCHPVTGSLCYSHSILLYLAPTI